MFIYVRMEGNENCTLGVGIPEETLSRLVVIAEEYKADYISVFVS